MVWFFESMVNHHISKVIDHLPSPVVNDHSFTPSLLCLWLTFSITAFPFIGNGVVLIYHFPLLSIFSLGKTPFFPPQAPPVNGALPAVLRPAVVLPFPPLRCLPPSLRALSILALLSAFLSLDLPCSLLCPFLVVHPFFRARVGKGISLFASPSFDASFKSPRVLSPYPWISVSFRQSSLFRNFLSAPSP